MNAKKGFELLKQLKEKDVRSQFNSFMNKKSELNQQQCITKYQNYLESIMPQLSAQQEALEYYLNIERPLLNEKPSLQRFFELFQEEQQLSFELSKHYTNTFHLELQNFLNECTKCPWTLLSDTRVYMPKEFARLTEAMKLLSTNAEKLSKHIQSQQEMLPMSTLTYKYLSPSKNRLIPKTTKDLQENFLYQVASCCYDALQQDKPQKVVRSQHMEMNTKTYKDPETTKPFSSIGNRQSIFQIFNKAFEIPLQQLRNAVNIIENQVRYNAEQDTLVTGFKTSLIQLNELVNELDEFQEDEDQSNYELPHLIMKSSSRPQSASVLSAAQIQEKLNKVMSQQGRNEMKLEKTQQAPKGTQNTILTEQILSEAEINLIKHKVQKETQDLIIKQANWVNEQLEAAENSALQVIRQEAINRQDQQAEKRRQDIQYRKDLIQNEIQARIAAAEKDAERVRPEVPDDPERIHRPTAGLVARKLDATIRSEILATIGRGQSDMIYSGERIQGTVNAGMNKAVSFDVMCALAEQGVLNTQAGAEALAHLRQTETTTRFPSWALRDDVKRIL